MCQHPNHQMRMTHWNLLMLTYPLVTIILDSYLTTYRYHNP